MHGNVWEWCGDCYADYSGKPETDPVGPAPENSSYRVYRGGSWLNDPQLCRSANRLRVDPSYRYVNLGFRLAVSVRP